MKAAQVTISELLVNEAFFCCDTGYANRGNCLYLFPIKDQVSDFANARIEPEIMGSPHLQLARETIKKRTGYAVVNNIGQKQFNKGYLYLRGSTSRNALKSIDADLVIYDEIDDMNPEAIAMGKERTGSCKFPLYRGVSTPRFPGMGVHNLIQQSDYMVWMVQCERCNHYSDLSKVLDVIIPIPSDSSLLTVDDSPERGTLAHIGSRYYVGCPSCKHVLNVWNGSWEATFTENTAFRGYHVPKLISDHLDFDGIAKTVEDHVNNRLDETKTQEFFNQVLGIPRAPQGFQLDFPSLMKCTESVPEEFNLPTGDFFSSINQDLFPLDGTYLGIDVGTKVVHIAVVGFPAHNDSLLSITSDHRPILLAAGSIRLSDNVTGFGELDLLLSRYKVRRCVIDRMPEYKQAAEFSRRNPGRVFVCSYAKWNASQRGNTIFEFKHDKGSVAAGRTETIDVIFDLINQQRLLLPRNLQVVGGNINKRGFGEFVQHLTNVVRVIDQETQEITYTEGSLPDHLLHALNYALIAAEWRLDLEGTDDEYKYAPGSITGVTGSAAPKSSQVATFMSSALTSARRGGSRLDGGQRHSRGTGGFMGGPGSFGY